MGIIHVVGNLHVFKGPDDFNGYGYFYVRLYFTGFGLPANIVEEYVVLAALLHVAVALKRTADISINYTISSGKLNLAISGVCLLAFLIIHLFQFRFGETNNYKLCPPPYYINLSGILSLDLFWTSENGCKLVNVRDIYRLEYDLFKSGGWVLFYLSSVSIFAVHMCLGWAKAVPAPHLDIPKRYRNKAIHVGFLTTAFIALMYMSLPIFCYLTSMKDGSLAAPYPK